MKIRNIWPFMHFPFLIFMPKKMSQNVLPKSMTIHLFITFEYSARISKPKCNESNYHFMCQSRKMLEVISLRLENHVSIDDSHKRKSYWISLRADPFSFCTTVRMSVVGFFLFFSRCFHLESNRNRLRCAQSVQKIYRKFTIRLHFQWLMLSIFVCFLAIFRCFSSYQRPQ